MSELALIELGSNVEPERNLPLALEALKDLGRLTAASTVYRTAPFGPPGQPHFLNAAAALTTELEPRPLKRSLRSLEEELGRVRTEERYMPRPIDLDICLYGSHIIQHDRLRIPDPDIFERPYLAITLAEIAGDHRHPITGEPLSQIAERMAPESPLTPDPEVTSRFVAILDEARA